MTSSKSRTHSCRVIFFDPLPGGHRAQYANALIETLNLRPDIEAVFFLHPDVCEEVARNVQIKDNVQLRHAIDSMQVHAGNKDILGGIRALKAIESAAKELKIDLVYLLHLDTFLIPLSIALRNSQKILYSGIIFKINSHYSKVFGNKLNVRELVLSFTRDFFLNLICKSGRFLTLHTLDPYSSLTGIGSEKLKVLNDLVCSSIQPKKPDFDITEWMDKPARLLLFGSISDRKGIRELLKAIENIDFLTSKCLGLLVCGVFDPKLSDELINIKAKLKEIKPETNIVFCNEFISDSTLYWLLVNCTAVLAPYIRHVGSSGVLHWAATSGRPILTQEFGLLGYEAEKFGLGWTFDPSSPTSFATHLASLASVSGTNYVDHGGRAAFLMRSESHPFANTIIDSLDIESRA